MSEEKIKVEEFEDIESKVINAAQNNPSGYYDIAGVKVKFKRPKLFNKYRGRVWANERLKEIGIEDLDNDEQGLVFYYRFIGALCMNVVDIVKEDGTHITLTPDDEYTFILEKYLEEEINAKGQTEEAFVDKLSDAFSKWDTESTPTAEELKKS